ncbi:energy-coupling factor transporter transmembrane component T family protein [Hydrogenoanaerobacterium sp.]|uniref:energy-coupling factor transporter transmembrane component T family protein n=1 Tax=Hydrogenoanaerobacterium sp. TaxID=2953763 RepID=UPI0037C14DE3
MKASLSYINRRSVIHSLTGTTKLIGFFFWSIGAMFTYDTRVLLAMFAMSVGIFLLSKIKFHEVSFALAFMLTFLILNNLAIFFFAPEEGVRIYGTRHLLFHLVGPYHVTLEQLFYMFNVSLKYFTVIPIALLFIVATDPSEFASSLSSIGVSYRVGYSVSIALRYVPDIQRDFHNISQAQQARGIDLSKKEKLSTRLKNAAAILMPLILSSLTRIEVISNAMELRGFGKHNKRTWYNQRPFRARDFIAIAFVTVVMVSSLVITFYDGNRFYNPFL